MDERGPQVSSAAADVEHALPRLHLQQLEDVGIPCGTSVSMTRDCAAERRGDDAHMCGAD